MPQYTFHYFNGRGIAEHVRFILAYGNANWIDKRFELVPPAPPLVIPEDLKPHCLYGQVPVLEFEGQYLTQSHAISRFLAKRLHLNGSDELEAARVDEVVDGLRDMMESFRKVFFEQDDARKPGIVAAAHTAALTKYMPVFNSKVEKNGGHVVGKSVTWADFFLATITSQFEGLLSIDIIGDFPALKVHREMVEGLPGIKEYLAKRPETPF